MCTGTVFSIWCLSVISMMSLEFNYFSSSFIFILISSLLSVSFSFWKLHTTVVDFMPFVTAVGILKLNVLLEHLSIETFWTRSCMLFNTKSGTTLLMVSLTSSPWNDYCSAQSFFSALCPSVILAWYSWYPLLQLCFLPSLPLWSLLAYHSWSVLSFCSGNW